MRVLFVHPWGRFDSACCSAAHTAQTQFEYFQYRNWDVCCVMLEIPAWGVTVREPTLPSRFDCVKSVHTLRLDCPPIESRQYGDGFRQLLYASERIAHSSFREFSRQSWDAFITSDVIAASFALTLPRGVSKILVTADSYARQLAASEGTPIALREAESRFTFARIEAELYRVFDRVLVCSEADVLAAQREGVNSAMHIPPLMHEPNEHPLAETSEQHDLLICGGTRPGELADVEWFYRHVYLPHLRSGGVRLTIAGPVAEQFSVADLRVTKLPTTAGMYRAARVVVAPAYEAMGPCVPVMEALAAGRAVVSSPVGIRGLDMSEDAAVIIAMHRDPAGTATVIRDLLVTPGWRRALGERAAQVKQQHTRERVFTALDSAWGTPMRSSRFAEVS